jgi:hypothetical protein
MGYHPRIENSKIGSFQTTRTIRSELWFVNNKPLEDAILGYLAKYKNRYGVQLYAFSIEGNHIQFPALFPKANRCHFMRDLNSSIARALPRYQAKFLGGRLFARRYSAEYLPAAEDIEEQFFYTVLQPVQDGLVDNIRQYPGYNCFEDAITGRVRIYKVVKWKEYNDAKRWNPNVDISQFIEEVELKFTRLPGYSKLSQKEYENMMREKLRIRTKEAIERRKSKGASLGVAALRLVRAGSRPKNTKISHINSHRPRVLSKDNERRAAGKAWYFSIYFDFRECSAKYRAGDLKVKFPPGTFKPPMFTVKDTSIITF